MIGNENKYMNKMYKKKKRNESINMFPSEQ